MVWNSTQSALYKAVDAYNGGDSGRKITAEKKVRKSAQKSDDFPSRNNAENCREKTPENHSENYVRNECRGRPKNVPPDPISRIMSDRDMLLIVGLMYILWRENADRKLILALAIVLLG